MTEAAPRVLIVANRGAATDRLLEAVRQRARSQPVAFHLLVPATPRGLHRDLPRKVRGMGKPVTHVEAARAPSRAEDMVADDRAA